VSSTSGIGLTVVVPTYGQGRDLRPLIQSIESSRPGPFEVLIIVNHPSRSREYSEMIAKMSDQVEVLESPEVGTNYARNYGAQRAKGRWLLFLDDDCRFTTPDQLLRVLRLAEHSPDVAFGGFYRTPVSGTFTQRLYNFISNAWLTLYKKDEASAYTFLGGAFLIQSDQFEKVGGFDEEVQGAGEEWSLAKKLYPTTVSLSGELNVWHSFVGGMTQFWRKKVGRVGGGLSEAHQRSFKEKVFALFRECARGGRRSFFAMFLWRLYGPIYIGVLESRKSKDRWRHR
tara:strand:+ start:268 stop:1122 length:855 start_codon:yes stop_codon:yes gene_type:complete